jgi:tripartite-type tricarboxylate transporter receptor subunit TctC
MPQIPSTSYSLNVAAGTPKPVVDKLYAAATHAMQQQTFRDQMAKVHMVVIADTPEQAAKKLADDARFYADIAKRIGL